MLRRLKELFVYRELLFILTQRKLKVRYKQIILEYNVSIKLNGIVVFIQGLHLYKLRTHVNRAMVLRDIWSVAEYQPLVWNL
jgi:hypothetical protein